MLGQNKMLIFSWSKANSKPQRLTFVLVEIIICLILVFFTTNTRRIYYDVRILYKDAYRYRHVVGERRCSFFFLERESNRRCLIAGPAQDTEAGSRMRPKPVYLFHPRFQQTSARSSPAHELKLHRAHPSERGSVR